MARSSSSSPTPKRRKDVPRRSTEQSSTDALSVCLGFFFLSLLGAVFLERRTDEVVEERATGDVVEGRATENIVVEEVGEGAVGFGLFCDKAC